MENHEVSVLNVNVNVETIWGTGRRFSQEIYEIPKEFEQGGFSLIGDLQVYKEQTPIHKDLLSEGIHTYLSVPLIVQRELIGAIHLGAHQPDAFDLEQIEIAREFASQMAIAIGQQRLDEQVRVGRAQLRKLTQRVLSVQDEERRRLSRELHDEAGQDLTALKISLELIKKEIPLEFNAIHDRLGEAITLTDITMEQIRLLAKGLRPPALDAVGLKYTLEDLCRDFARRSNIKIEYTGADLPLLSEEINICFYRILQESLTNACKHARADHIFVTLRQEVGNICLVVKDDGQGFRKKNLNRNSMGIGLLGIKERLKMLGGRFEVKSQPGQGTILIAYIPWQENT
jgi:signal transduction histidine kinase